MAPILEPINHSTPSPVLNSPPSPFLNSPRLVCQLLLLRVQSHLNC